MRAEEVAQRAGLFVELLQQCGWLAESAVQLDQVEPNDEMVSGVDVRTPKACSL